MLKKYKYEILLLLITIFWLLFFSFVLQLKINFLLEGDEPGYFDAAQKLYVDFKLDDGRPLLISAINGFPLLFGLNSQYLNYWIFIVNLLCWLGTIFLVFAILSEKFNKKAGFYFALIFMFSLGNLILIFKVLSESVFIFSFVLSLYFYHKQLFTNDYKYLIFAISTFFLSSLIKPIAFGMAFILILISIKKLKLVILNRFVILVLLSILLVFYQMNTLKKNYGNFTISYIDGFTYYNYLGARADCLKNNTKFLQAQNPRFIYLNKFSHVDQKKIVFEDFKNQLTNNTSNLFQAYIINIISNSTHGSPVIDNCKNFNNTSYFNFFRIIFKIISKLQNIIFTICGVYMSFYILRKHKIIDKLFFIIAILFFYVFLLSAISSNQGDRLHLVLFPLVILMFANFSNKIITKKSFLSL
ncbi:MAG: glycosyltransferase family 39 protein [Flavobacterium sp.]|nr:glycosyltransferase family 39 protein [Flavobacterium sp.]